MALRETKPQVSPLRLKITVLIAGFGPLVAIRALGRHRPLASVQGVFQLTPCIDSSPRLDFSASTWFPA